VFEKAHTNGKDESRGILICTHAAPLIAIGRVLTGNMPEDSSVEDFKTYTASLSTFVRRRGVPGLTGSYGESQLENDDAVRTVSGTPVPLWRGGKGVGGGWDCVGNGECGFLTGGEERGWCVYSYILSSFSLVSWPP
jgi:transcription factor C subunit 7